MYTSEARRSLIILRRFAAGCPCLVVVGVALVGIAVVAAVAGIALAVAGMSAT